MTGSESPRLRPRRAAPAAVAVLVLAGTLAACSGQDTDAGGGVTDVETGTDVLTGTDRTTATDVVTSTVTEDDDVSEDEGRDGRPLPRRHRDRHRRSQRRPRPVHRPAHRPSRGLRPRRVGVRR